MGAILILFTGVSNCQESPDKPDCKLRQFQFRAIELKAADWIHWGDQPTKFSNWTDHSNRLIPVYTWGTSLESVKGKNSVYRDAEKLKEIFEEAPAESVNPKAKYFDQTQIYDLQKQAWKAGKKNVILMVFDGMDWQTTQAASIYRNKKVLYEKGRGKGLAFLEYDRKNSDFGYCVTSPFSKVPKHDLNAQIITEPKEFSGGYSAEFGGETPWSKPGDPSYLLGKRKTLKHSYTDSAASATSMNSGRKTYNASINMDPEGRKIKTLAHEMQEAGFAIGVVTSVPICHATPSCVYAHNIHRSDYQDLTRDLLGLKSASHRDDPLSGVDVLIGGGWGIMKDDDRENQGENYIPGNKYLNDSSLEKIDVSNGGKYTVAIRTEGQNGNKVLMEGASEAAKNGTRFFGFFGATGGHLPYQTADGLFDPTRGMTGVDKYEPADISENPVLADMARAALSVLEKNEKGFYLMIEAGDVDWANHNNNIDDSIGAVFSGEAAFTAITQWVEKNSNWDETCLILTADHGHFMVLDDPKVLIGTRPPESDKVFKKKRDEKRKRDAIAKAKKEAEKKAKAEAKAKKAAEKKAKAAAEKAKKKKAKDKKAKDEKAKDKKSMPK